MAEYVDVKEAVDLPGLRLVLSQGVPGPWGEAAKGLFTVKKIPFVRVRQLPGLDNPELLEWTGHDNAPIAVYERERPRALWSELIWLAERLAPDPPLVPSDPAERARMFGLLFEIAGENGLGWLRRLMMFHQVLSLPPEKAGAQRDVVELLGGKYGYEPGLAASAPGRVASTLELLAATLRAQKERGHDYFLGASLSALDIYWAAFAALFGPLPEAQCPMPRAIRHWYEARDPTVQAALDPILMEHRDLVYQRHLELPVDV
jgi:glutathione S-transferase